MDNDHGWPFRQKIIHGPDAPKYHFQELIKRGLSYEDAVNMSGHNPIDELEDTFLLILKWAMIVAMVCGALMLISSSETMADDLEGSKASENALVACVNGKVVFIGREAFYCTSIGEVK
jgi:hypothetical protein